MSALELKKYPDPCLRIKTKRVEAFNDDLRETMRLMSKMMYSNQGIGLAATQVGLGLSVMTIDVGDGLMNFVNPKIVETSREKTGLEEGCLSLPGVTVNVVRPEKVKVRAQDEKGEFFVKQFEGLLSKAVQHEMDHLSGRLIIDYLNPLKYFLTVRKFKSSKGCPKKTCQVVCGDE